MAMTEVAVYFITLKEAEERYRKGYVDRWQMIGYESIRSMMEGMLGPGKSAAATERRICDKPIVASAARSKFEVVVGVSIKDFESIMLGFLCKKCRQFTPQVKCETIREITTPHTKH
jgi:hypothetical protein